MNAYYFSSLKADSKPIYRQNLDLVGFKVVHMWYGKTRVTSYELKA